jgi:hypothetical protein
MQFMSGVFGLLALIPMVLNGFVQPVVRADDTLLAVVLIGMQAGRCVKQQKSS